jgi:multidrug resistance efflux pump
MQMGCIENCVTNYVTKICNSLRQQGYLIQEVRQKCKIIAAFKEIEVTGESLGDSVNIMLFAFDRKIQFGS